MLEVDMNGKSLIWESHYENPTHNSHTQKEGHCLIFQKKENKERRLFSATIECGIIKISLVLVGIAVENMTD